MTDKSLSKIELIRVHMISSFLQITLSLPISHPIDTLKSRIQTRVYTGSISNIFKQMRQSGFVSMYKGYSAMYLNLVMKQPAKLAVYENIKNPLLAGLSAGLIGLGVGIPMSYIKTNYQVHSNFDIRNLFRMGFSGFTKSFVAWKYEGAKELAGNTAFYGLYKILNGYRQNHLYYDNLNVTHILLSGILNKITPDVVEQRKKIIHLENGAIAGFFGTFLSYPIDTMKSHKQTLTQSGDFKTIFNEIYYGVKIHPENINLFKQKNWHITPSYINFFKGVTITATKHGVIGGVGMLLYESIKPQVHNYILNTK